MTIRVALNGLGRIGRAALRAYCARRNLNFVIVAVNDIMEPETVAHLFRYDTVHGRWPGTVMVKDGRLTIDRHDFVHLRETRPHRLPWRELGVDVVLEATGQFRHRALAQMHRTAGAHAVLVSAPFDGADGTFVVGVNHDRYDPVRHLVASNASCTANCIAPIIAVLSKAFGWLRGYMTTVHPMTADQRVVDQSHADLRRARATGAGVIPTSSSAIGAVQAVLPALARTFDGMAYRVPTLYPAVADLVLQVERVTTKEVVNDVLRRAAFDLPPNVLAVSDEPLVAADYVGDPHSAIVDAECTAVTGRRQIHVTAWYDNETGYAHRLVDMLSQMAGAIACMNDPLGCAPELVA